MLPAVMSKIKNLKQTTTDADRKAKLFTTNPLAADATVDAPANSPVKSPTADESQDSIANITVDHSSFVELASNASSLSEFDEIWSNSGLLANTQNGMKFLDDMSLSDFIEIFSHWGVLAYPQNCNT